jgi:hypothetical protein
MAKKLSCIVIIIFFVNYKSSVRIIAQNIRSPAKATAQLQASLYCLCERLFFHCFLDR